MISTISSDLSCSTQTPTVASSITLMHWTFRFISSQSAKQAFERCGRTAVTPLFYFKHRRRVFREASDSHLLALNKIKAAKLPVTTLSCCAVACTEARAESTQILTALMNRYMLYPEGQSAALLERLLSPLDENFHLSSCLPALRRPCFCSAFLNNVM